VHNTLANHSAAIALASPRGFEPQEQNAEDIDKEVECENGKSPPSSLASPNPGKPCPELARIVAAWPNLATELKAAISAIADLTNMAPS